jgi:hypothetical protein
MLPGARLVTWMGHHVFSPIMLTVPERRLSPRPAKTRPAQGRSELRRRAEFAYVESRLGRWSLRATNICVVLSTELGRAVSNRSRAGATLLAINVDADCSFPSRRVSVGLRFRNQADHDANLYTSVGCADTASSVSPRPPEGRDDPHGPCSQPGPGGERIRKRGMSDTRPRPAASACRYGFSAHFDRYSRQPEFTSRAATSDSR